jgi:acetyl esterase
MTIATTGLDVIDETRAFNEKLAQTLAMADRWRAAGNEATLEVVAEAVHGFTAFPITVARRELASRHEFVAAALA